jgi:hypothetical protein
MLAEKNLGMLPENSEIVNFLNISERLFNYLAITADGFKLQKRKLKLRHYTLTNIKRQIYLGKTGSNQKNPLNTTSELGDVTFCG